MKMIANASEARDCLRDPIPELLDAARFLDAAVSAYDRGEIGVAEALIRLADMPAITEWTESLWGAGGPWTRPLKVNNPAPFLTKDQRHELRMPSELQKRELLARDGHRCRFCGIPVIRRETRSLIQSVFPAAVRWGNKNVEQHAAFQALWLQYDHILPHARGGSSEPSNMIVTCAPCNNGRSNLTLEEAGLRDPMLREPQRSDWDGLARFQVGRTRTASEGARPSASRARPS